MKRLLVLSMLFGGALFGQTATCQFSFNFNQATGFTSQPSPNGYDNRLKGCNAFTLNYQTAGLSAVSVQLDSAGGAGTAGSWAAYSGTVLTGANPSTNTAGTQATFSGYVGWLRVTVNGTPTGSTWSITGVVYGAQTGGAGGAATGGSCTVPGAASCYVQGPNADGATATGFPLSVGGVDAGGVSRHFSTNTNGVQAMGQASTGADGVGNTNQAQIVEGQGATAGPLQTVPSYFNGATWDRALVCNKQQFTNVSAASSARIVTNSATGKRVKICHMHETTGATLADITVQSGTGSVCGTGTATIDGFTGQTAVVIDYSPFSPLNANAVNDDICLSFSVSLTGTVEVIYAETP